MRGLAMLQMMFGRTPTCQHDTFHTFLDEQWVDFDEYVQWLRHDLAETMGIDQIFTRQHDLYNRKLKGSSLNVRESHTGLQLRLGLKETDWSLQEQPLDTFRKLNTHTFYSRPCVSYPATIVTARLWSQGHGVLCGSLHLKETVRVPNQTVSWHISWQWLLTW